MNTGIFRSKYLWILITIIFCSINLLAQDQNPDSTKNNYEGDWDADGSWIDGSAVPNYDIVDDVVIYGFITSNDSVYFADGGANKTSLSIYDTLIVHGSVYLGLDDDFFIGPDAIVIIYGNFTCFNQVNIVNEGYFIVTGYADFNGGESSYSGDGCAYILGDVYIPETGKFNNLNCYPPGNPTVCGCGDTAALIEDPIIDFIDETLSECLITPTPSLTGNTTVCPNSSGNIYTTEPGRTNYDWDIIGGTITAGGGSNDNTVTVTWTAAGMQQISVSYERGICKSDTVSLNIDLSDCTVEAAFSAPKLEVCLEEQITIIDESVNTNIGTGYSWDFGAGANPPSSNTQGDQVISYLTPGLKKISLTLTAANIDSETKTGYINVYGEPDVSVPDSLFRCGEGQITLNATVSNADRVYFSLDTGNSISTIDSVSPYQLVYPLENGDIKTVWVKVNNSRAGCFTDFIDSAVLVSNYKPGADEINVSGNLNPYGNYFDVICQHDIDRIYTISPKKGSSYKWNISGLGITNEITDQLEVTWDIKFSPYVLTINEITDKLCEGYPFKANVLVNGLNVDLGADEVNICMGESYTFEVRQNYNIITWHDGSGLSSYTTSVEETAALVVEDNYGCFASDTAEVIYYPEASVFLGNDTVLAEGEYLEIRPGLYDSYLWSTGDVGSSIIVDATDQEIWLEVIDENGCMARDTLLISVITLDDLIEESANTFTPNNDGKHDTWVIKFLEQYPEANIKVYDRLGRVVFKNTTTYQNDWNGTDQRGQPLPVDSYHYIVDLKNGSKPIRGIVTIFR